MPQTTGERLRRHVDLRPRVGVVAFSSPLEVGAERAPKVAAELAVCLRKAGCETISGGTVDSPAAAAAVGRRLATEQVCAVVAAATSWFEDYLALDLLEELPAPLLLWPQPGMETGALCGTQQLTCYLRYLEHPYTCVFGVVGDTGCLRTAMAYLRAAALKHELRRARIGMAGRHVPGMTHTAPDEFLLKKVLGPRVVWLDLPALLGEAEGVARGTAARRWAKLRQRAGCCTVTGADGIDSMRVYEAVRAAVLAHGLSALTIGCYPELMGRVCLAASLLADDGVPLACEGDVHGAICQYILQRLTGQPTHNTDWLDPVDEHSAVFTHCGSGSFSLAARPDRVSLQPVRLMDRGVCALFTAKPGPVTLLGLALGPGGYRLALLQGEALPTGMVFPGNPVRVRFDQPVKDLMAWIHRSGIGHHWMIGYGHVAGEVRAWSGLTAGLALVEP